MIERALCLGGPLDGESCDIDAEAVVVPVLLDSLGYDMEVDIPAAFLRALDLVDPLPRSRVPAEFEHFRYVRQVVMRADGSRRVVLVPELDAGDADKMSRYLMRAIG